MIQLNILYKPKKHFFKMNIDELKEYVYKCKYNDDINKKLIKKAGKKRKTRRRKKTRRKKTRRKKI
tara:strand:- start:3634 stop:3831 length:198 start_codon:yes stop_codon:yes gene_type:complete